MSPRLALPLVAIFAITALSGCTTPGPDVADPRPEQAAQTVKFVTDAAGDAVVGSTTFAGSAVSRCQVSPTPARDGCSQAIATVRDALPPAGGRPAPASLDLLGASLQEFSDRVVVTMEVASLDAGLDGAAASDGSTAGVWSTCWVAGGDEEKGWECAYVVVGFAGDKPVVETYFDRYTPDCNDWWWCSWNVQAKFTNGSPGSISLTVPRFLLGQTDAGGRLATPIAGTGQCTYVSDTVRWSTHGANEDMGAFFSYVCETVDQADAGADFTLAAQATPADPALHPLAPFANDAAPVDGRRDTDILDVTLSETPTTVTASIQMAVVEAQAQDHATDFSIGLPDGRVYEAGYDMLDGKMEPWGGYCDDAECNEWLELVPAIERIAGAPGWINITYDRTTIGSPAAGSLLNLAYFYIAPVTVVGQELPGVGGAGATILGRGEWSATLPPQFLALDTV